jgi:Zn-dependent peptidase ImmA (M78 family)
MIYDPWRDLRDRAHIAFGITDLPFGDGWWLPQVPAIVLGRHLNRVERRCTLAHELVHAEHHETQCAGDGAGTARIARRRELDADETAARRLIRLDQLIDALRWALGPDELAEVLDVTERMARIRIRTLTDDEKAIIAAALATDDREIA